MKLNKMHELALHNCLEYLPVSDMLNLRTVSKYLEHSIVKFLKNDLFKSNRYKLLDVSVGFSYTLTLMETSQGEQILFVWGNNQEGQLGLNHISGVNKPTSMNLSFLNGAKIISIKTIYNQSFIIAENTSGENVIFSFGYNQYGQLGLGHNRNVHTPRPINLSNIDITKIENIYGSVGSTIIHAKNKDGQDRLFSFGDNIKGQLGLGHNNLVLSPQAINMSFLNGGKIKSIIFDRNYIIVLSEKDNQVSLTSWGSNQYGQLGLGHQDDMNTPQQVDSTFLNNLNVIQLCGGLGSNLIHANNESGADLLFSWGMNFDGQLGLSHDFNINAPQPIDMSFLRGATVKNIHMSLNTLFVHARVTSELDFLFSCGHNEFGELGLGHNNDMNTLQPINMNFLNGLEIKQLVISIGRSIILAENQSGQRHLFGFGYNLNNQLGFETNDISINTPQEANQSIFNGNMVKRIFHGYDHYFIHTENENSLDSLYGVGCNGQGRLGVRHSFDTIYPSKVSTSLVSSSTFKTFETMQLRRRLESIKKSSENPLLKNAIHLGYGAIWAREYFSETLSDQAIGSMSCATLTLLCQGMINRDLIKQASLSYNDPSIDKKSNSYNQGKQSATNTCAYMLSYFRVCGKKASNEWHAGYAAGLLEKGNNQRKLKIK